MEQYYGRYTYLFHLDLDQEVLGPVEVGPATQAFALVYQGLEALDLDNARLVRVLGQDFL